MDKYKVVIVDDDVTALENLRVSLAKDKRFSVEGVARTGEQACKVVHEIMPDLLFLDVELPDMTGMDLLHELRESVPSSMRVVFYTAYDKYMIEAIRGAAFDYLLKPFDEPDLTDILNRFAEHADEASPYRPAPLSALSSAGGQPFIVFTPANEMRALRPAEIGFFRYRSDCKQWEAVLANGHLLLRRSTKAEQILQYYSSFVQVHQSYIINIDYLMLIKENQCQLYPPFDKVTELQVSRKYKKELQERFCL